MTALESAHGFSAFMLSVFTIKTFAAEGDVETHMADLRSSYLPAVALSLAIGWIASQIVESWWPLAGAIGVSAGMILVYEVVIVPGSCLRKTGIAGGNEPIFLHGMEGGSLTLRGQTPSRVFVTFSVRRPIYGFHSFWPFSGLDNGAEDTLMAME
jgi:hypothetical protein